MSGLERMVLSTAGYAFFGTNKTRQEKLNYKGVAFQLGDDGLWHFKMQNYDFSTRYNPAETENISFFLALSLGNYQGKPLYFSYDSDRQGVEEISRNLGRFAERIQYACLEECKEDFPVKNCTENIIILKQGNANESLIKQEDSCVYILAGNEEVLRASDAFILRILGLN